MRLEPLKVTSDGTGVDVLLRQLGERDIEVGSWAGKLLVREDYTKSITTGVDYLLPRIVAGELPKERQNLPDIIKFAFRERKLGLCVPESAGLLRRDCSQSVLGAKRVVVCHPAIKASHVADPAMFILLEDDDHLMLGACRVHRFDVAEDDVFVFDSVVRQGGAH